MNSIHAPWGQNAQVRRRRAPRQVFLALLFTGFVACSSGRPGTDSGSEPDATEQPDAGLSDDARPTEDARPAVDAEASRSEDCPDLDGLDGPPTVDYYRLRFEYASSSDWSELIFSDSTPILKVRMLSREGEADRNVADYGGLRINQPSASATAGQVVKLTADYAFRPEATKAPLALTLGQGSIGSVSVKISTVVGDQVELVHEVEESGGSELEVDLSSLQGVSPEQGPLAAVRRMAWALYYPWYELSWWGGDDLLDQPEMPYDSGDARAIGRQIDQAQSAGIEGFISSWWGPGSRTDDNLAVVLDVAQRKNFFIAMFLETKRVIADNDNDMSRVEDDLVSWLEYYVTTYGNHPATMKVDGKPVVMPWVTCTVPVETWRNVRQRLASSSSEVTLLADCDRPEHIDVLDGALGRNADQGKAVRYHALLSDNPRPKIWISDAMPGYDERLLGRDSPRYIDREEGQYFHGELTDALQANPQWVRVYTWNEYPENTYIEPSQNFGDQYLNIAAEYLLPWRCAP